MNFLQPENGNRSPGLYRWARLRVNIPISLRRGAWYTVLSAGAEEAVLEVRGVPTILDREAVEIVHARPQTWSMVPAEWGGPYLVCPDCAERVRNVAATGRLICPHCHSSYAIALEREIVFASLLPVLWITSVAEALRARLVQFPRAEPRPRHSSRLLQWPLPPKAPSQTQHRPGPNLCAARV